MRVSEVNINTHRMVVSASISINVGCTEYTPGITTCIKIKYISIQHMRKNHYFEFGTPSSVCQHATYCSTVEQRNGCK